MARGNIHIGTSGWHYKHWKRLFYPDKLKDTEQLNFYAQSFCTVEINNSFYRVPATATFEKWKDTVDDDFLFSVKANRYITHQKKLHDVKNTTLDFIRQASHMDDKLGPILFQLPPAWKLNIERLSSFLDELPKSHRYAFEFRNHSWYSNETYQLLRQHNCAFCIYELAGHLSPIETTADFIYVRLHGPGEKYQGKYTDTSLSSWAKHCHKWQNEGQDVFFYFDNDQEAYATFNARTLIDLTRQTA